MVLVDTSVWVDHLRGTETTLVHLLNTGQVCMHPMVIGELACGNLSNRKQLITLWRNLPLTVEASHDEALFTLDTNGLMGKGIGFVDLHLLASALLTPNTQLWTRDKRLARIANELIIGFHQH